MYSDCFQVLPRPIYFIYSAVSNLLIEDNNSAYIPSSLVSKPSNILSVLSNLGTSRLKRVVFLCTREM